MEDNTQETMNYLQKYLEKNKVNSIRKKREKERCYCLRIYKKKKGQYERN